MYDAKSLSFLHSFYMSYAKKSQQLKPGVAQPIEARAVSFLTCCPGIKVQLSTMGKVIEGCFLLTSTHTLLNGSQVWTYFQDPTNPLDLIAPTVEDYFGLPNVAETDEYYWLCVIMSNFVLFVSWLLFVITLFDRRDEIERWRCE